jgi:hypothetical protein
LIVACKNPSSKSKVDLFFLDICGTTATYGCMIIS